MEHFVFTSSGSAVTSLYAKSPQVNVPSAFQPKKHKKNDLPFASHYSRTKFAAEKLVLAASEPSFVTLAFACLGSMAWETA